MTRTLATRICAAIIAIYAVGLYATRGFSEGWPGTGRVVSQSDTYVDYVAIWSAGRLALDGRPADAYDWQAHGAATHELLGRERPDYQPWPYPPTFLLVAALMALIPYGTSMLVWIVATYAAFAASAARIIGTREGALWMGASVAALYNASVGQNGALSAAILGLGLVLVPTRPVLAGIFLGALSYKPHLGILIPFALAAAGYWRTFVSAAATVVAMAAVSVLAFGIEPWLAFVERTDDVADLVLNRFTERLQSVYGVLVTSGLPASFAMAVHTLAVVAAGVGITLFWRRSDVPYDLKAAALAAAALLVSPYLFIYDLSLLMVAQAFILRSALAEGVHERELDGLLVANALVALAPAAGFPLGPAATLLMLVLVAWRLMRGRSETIPALPSTANAMGA